MSILVHKPDHTLSLAIANHHVAILQVCQSLQGASPKERPEIGETLIEPAWDQRTPARSLRCLKTTEPFETPNIVQELMETQPLEEQEGGKGTLQRTQANWKLKADETKIFL